MKTRNTYETVRPIRINDEGMIQHNDCVLFKLHEDEYDGCTSPYLHVDDIINIQSRFMENDWSAGRLRVDHVGKHYGKYCSGHFIDETMNLVHKIPPNHYFTLSTLSEYKEEMIEIHKRGLLIDC
jgi:hypothetical protein